MANGKKGASEDMKALYKLMVELHNKVTDSLNHLSYEKESLEDATDALARARKLSKELDQMLPALASAAGDGSDLKRDVAKFRAVAEKFNRELSEYAKDNKRVFDSATEFAQQWNAVEEQIGNLAEKLGSKQSTPTYIR